MKRILKITSLLLAFISLSSCYEDYVHDYDFPSMGFALNRQVRTVVSTTNQIYVGVSIGGKRSVDLKDWATFTFDQSLLTGTGLKMLPESYYVLADPNTFTVRKTNLAVADVGITFTEDFYADPACLERTYALPFRLVATSIDAVADSTGARDPYGAIREGGQTAVVAIKYISGFSGTYYKVGSVTEVDASGNAVGEAQTYANTDLTKNGTCVLGTSGRYSVVRPGLGNSADGSLSLTVSGGDLEKDSEVELAIPSGATLVQGSGRWVRQGDYAFYSGDKVAPQFNLDYTYSVDGKYYHVTEKLVLRQWAERELRVETF